MAPSTRRNSVRNDDHYQVYDVLVVGGGVVGLSIVRSATLHGWKCVLVEAESDLLSWASGSNSGIACTGVDAAPGSLERALIRDSISQIRGYCQTHNIPHRPCGSLVCRWSWDRSSNSNDDIATGSPSETSTLEDVLEESHSAGDTHASILSAKEVKHWEPNLSHQCTGAVHIPGEIVVDPWLFSIVFAVHARENGAQIWTNWKFDPTASSFDPESQIWTAKRVSRDENDDKPAFIRARAIVNACGVWSDLVQRDIHRSTGHRAALSSGQGMAPTQHWIAKPRRGQYRVFRTDPATHIQHPIQPIPTPRTKGIFVFGTLYDQVAVGPTAVDQDSRTDRSVDPMVAKELDRLVQKVIPALHTQRAHVGDCKLCVFFMAARERWKYGS